MAIDIHLFKTLSKDEQKREIERLESSHRQERKHLENVEKMCKAHLANEKTSATEAATIIGHYNEVKQVVKTLEDDMSLISAYTYNYGSQGTASNIISCVTRDPITAVKSILGNGAVHIRPGELCQTVAVGTMTFRRIKEERDRRKEAKVKSWWAQHHAEFNRSTKKDEPFEQKEQVPQKDQREQKEKAK